MANSNSSSSSTSGGMGCGGLLAVLLTVLFVGLKLTGNIAWSWIWVVSPIWIYILLAIAFLIVFIGGVAGIALVVGAISGLVKRHDRKRQRKRESK